MLLFFLAIAVLKILLARNIPCFKHFTDIPGPFYCVFSFTDTIFLSLCFTHSREVCIFYSAIHLVYLMYNSCVYFTSFQSLRIFFLFTTFLLASIYLIGSRVLLYLPAIVRVLSASLPSLSREFHCYSLFPLPSFITITSFFCSLSCPLMLSTSYIWRVPKIHTYS